MDKPEDFSNDRRRLITGGLTAAATLLVAQPALASITPPWFFFNFGHKAKQLPNRSLSFEHLHTGERLSITYAEHGRYIPGALHEINYLLRDFRAHEVKSIDPQLLDALHDVHTMLGTPAPFQVISGYRSAETNEGLREHSHGVAQNSFHIKGKAIDVCVEGRTPLQIRNAALTLQRGGVGYYPEGFVHIDTGPIRKWQG